MTFSSDVEWRAIEYFSFIKRDNLRRILAQNISYVYKLMDESDECTDKTLQLLINRDIAVHLGSVVEGVILYALQEYDLSGLLTQNKAKQFKIKSIIKSVPLKDGNMLAVAEEYTDDIKLNSSIQFIQLNRLAYRSGILNKELFEAAEFIREERNKIHSKKNYTINDVKKVFEASRKVKRHIVKKLEVL